MAHEQAPTPSVLLQVPPLAQDIAAHEGPERQQKDGVPYNIIISSSIIII